MNFNKEQHDTWKILCERQIPNMQKYACSLWLEGVRALDMPMDRIPTLEEMNEKLSKFTDWKLVETKIRYLSSHSWYEHLARKEMIITDFIRSREELDFTPEPDIFHDMMGHVPFFIHKEFTDFFEMFAPAYFAAEDEETRKAITLISWFSYEFGLIRENGEIKVGAGIISSKEETEKIMNGGVDILPFTITNVIKYEKAVFKTHDKLFVFNSFKELKKIVLEFFETIPKFEKMVEKIENMDIGVVKDHEMKFET